MATIAKTIKILSLLALIGCAQVHFTGGAEQEKWVGSVLWFQTAGEVQALSHQAFNVARMRLDQDLRSRGAKRSKQQRAIVVDVDETVLNNSPYQARAIVTGEGYPVGWANWIGMAQAQALPGAVEFLRYAASKGVSIFYITNRKEPGREATIKNLRTVGFPVKDDHVMLRTKSKSKVARRSRALENHRIVLLMGDTLSDFDEVFEHKSINERNSAVEKMRAEFGKRFIVLPNPMYGDWEGAVYNNQFSLPDKQKAMLRKKSLRYYR